MQILILLLNFRILRFKFLFLFRKKCFLLASFAHRLSHLRQFELKVTFLGFTFKFEVSPSLLKLLFLNLEVTNFGFVRVLLFCQVDLFSINFWPLLLGLDFSFDDLILDKSEVLQVFHFFLIDVLYDFLFFTLVVHFVVGFARFDLLDLLLKFPFPLHNRSPSLRNLRSLGVKLLFSSHKLVFAPIEFWLIGGTNFLKELLDVSGRLWDLLGELVDLDAFFELLLQVWLLILKQSPLIVQVFLILKFSIFQVNFVKLS